MLRRRLLRALLAACAVIGLMAQPALAAGPVVQPSGTFAGKTYEEWSARWWQWAFSLTAPNPFTDPSGASCGAGQRGPVWFLGGQFNADTSPTCSVPEGKAVLLPIVNGECSSLEGNGTSASVLKACAIAQMDAVDTSTLTATVDGQSVDAKKFRFLSKAYTITAVDGNAFGVPPGTGLSVADGYYVMLPPLKEGRHTVDVHADLPAFGAFITTHYTLLVRG